MGQVRKGAAAVARVAHAIRSAVLVAPAPGGGPAPEMQEVQDRIEIHRAEARARPKCAYLNEKGSGTLNGNCGDECGFACIEGMGV